MICDFYENLKCYSKSNEAVWREAFDFIASVKPDTEERKYPLRGQDLFALVQGYEPVPLNEGLVEIHRQYIDIHALVSGKELVYYSPISGLEEVCDYTPESDDVVYRFQKESASEFSLSPGKFLVFFPEEGHMPCIRTADSSDRVKKVVIKIAKQLI